jgi:hypothetical protein
MRRLLELWKQRARRLKTELYALYLAYKDPRVPWYARILDKVPLMVNEVDSAGIPPSGGPSRARLKAGFLHQDCKARLNLVLAAAVIVAIWLLLAGCAVGLLRPHREMLARDTRSRGSMWTRS